MRNDTSVPAYVPGRLSVLLDCAAVNFGGWVPFHDAETTAPEAPGVLQARADAPRSYPTGKSAMVLYASSSPAQTLREYLRGPGSPALSRAVSLGARLIRFGVSPRPDGEFERLMRRFVERFGARPAANDGGDDSFDTHEQSDADNKEQRRPNG